MVTALLALALSLQQADSATFQDAATAELYALARQRHIHQDTLVRDYQASVHTRLEASVGKSRFARQTTLMAHETMARITWKMPNDLKIQVVGTRAKVPLIGMLSGLADVGDEVEREIRDELVMDRPWFIPRAFGDSIRAGPSVTADRIDRPPSPSSRTLRSISCCGAHGTTRCATASLSEFTLL